MDWDYYTENKEELRRCNKCGLSQIKCKDGEWAVYITIERINKFFENMLDGIEENCSHTPDEDSD